jgi:hypothetical protein
MTETTAPDALEACVTSAWPMMLQDWCAAPAPHTIALRLAAGCATQPGFFSFMLEPEQARQLIRDLSRAVLEADLKRLA